MSRFAKVPFRFCLWALLSTAFLNSGCAWHPYKTAPGTSVIVTPIPKELAQPVAEPEPKGRTNGDLAEFADSVLAALREANRRLARLRDL